jgi:EmrB/QacA subfamily drug resistance transporter
MAALTTASPTLKSKNMGVIVGALLLSILMASMDNTIVATAMGTIVGDLGGLDKFVWVTSAYMVAEMAGMPIFGKLSDMYGRKRFFIFGLIIFMAGSMLCGTAHSIVELSIYRAIQGIGGGALIPIAFTIMFDSVPLESRGKLGGLFGAVFGMSSIFGPLLGAYFTDYIHWSWIFYINLPLGFIALAMIAVFYKESHEHSKQRIDWGGAVTLVGAVICLMFALELGGKEFAWDSFFILGLLSAFMLLVIAFIFIERRAEEPIISFGMFTKQLFGSSTLIGMFGGAAFITASVYIPIFIQGVLGGSATNSGLVLLPMMVGSVVTATLGGFLMNKISFRAIMIPSTFILVVGTLLLSTLNTESTRFTVTLYMTIVGLGIGASFSVLSNAVIHIFSIRQRGSATSTLNFVRSLGMTLGITVFGIIQSHQFTKKMADALGGEQAISQGLANMDPRNLLSPATRANIPPAVLDKITATLSSSISYTFMWAIIPAVLALLFTFTMGGEKLGPQPENGTSASGH